MRIDANLGTVLGVESLLCGTEGHAQVQINASIPGSFPGMVLDFGRVVVGYPQFQLHAPSGSVLDIHCAIPATGPESNNSVFPDFCIYWLLAVCDYWKYSSDEQFILDVRPHLELALAWLEKQRDADGLLGLLLFPDDYCFIDWSPYIDRREKVTAASWLYVKVLKVLAEMFLSFGWTDLSAHWATQAELTKAAIRTNCWEPERGLFIDCVTSRGIYGRI